MTQAGAAGVARAVHMLPLQRNSGAAANAYAAGAAVQSSSYIVRAAATFAALLRLLWPLHVLYTIETELLQLQYIPWPRILHPLQWQHVQ